MKSCLPLCVLCLVGGDIVVVACAFVFGSVIVRASGVCVLVFLFLVCFFFLLVLVLLFVLLLL